MTSQSLRLPDGRLRLPEFSATDDSGRKSEIQDVIDQLNACVTPLSPSKAFSEQYLSLVSKATSEAKLGNWDAAHLALWEAALLINRGIDTDKCKPIQWRLVALPLPTIVILASLAVLFTHILHRSHHDLYDLWWCDLKFLWIGAAGGVTIAYWGLVKHNIQLDFDRHYELWYWFKPLLGAIFGLVAVLILRAGISSLQFSTKEDASRNILLLYVVAYIAGFSERFFLQLFDRVVTAIFGGSPSQPQAAGTTPALTAKIPAAGGGKP